MHASLSAVRAVLFDAVGTLIYPDPSVVEAYHRAGRQYGSACSSAEINAGFRAALRRQQGSGTSSEQAERARWQRVVAEVFADVTDSQPLFEALWSHFAEAAHWALFDDVAEVWSELQARGYLLAVASNFDQRLPAMSAGLPPLDQAEAIFVSSQLGFAKPHPNFFRGIEAALKLRPAELLLVGDDPENDWHAARRAGWSALLLDRDGDSRQPAALSSLRELLSRLPQSTGLENNRP